MKFTWKNFKKPFFVLGPMADVTLLPFRLICKQFHPDIMFTPMVSSDAVIFNPKETLKLIQFKKKERPIIVQVFGYDSEKIVKAIKIIEKKLKPDGIDINLGCPSPKLVNNECGAALLKDHKKAFEMISYIRKNYKGQLSIKTRLGYSKFDVLPLIKQFESIGIDAITIHGRTKMQRYTGSANWEAIHEIANSVNIPIIGNGDITSWRLAHDELSKSKISGIMISREAMQRPWIFKEIKEKKDINLTNKELISLIQKQMKYYLAFDKKHVFFEMRKFLGYYIKGFKGASELRSKAVNIKNLKDFNKLIKELKYEIKTKNEN